LSLYCRVPLDVEDANLTESLSFDGLKIDSCGNQRNMTEWAVEFAKPGMHIHPHMIFL
jgi:hypothetical protein